MFISTPAPGRGRGRGGRGSPGGSAAAYCSIVSRDGQKRSFFFLNLFCDGVAEEFFVAVLTEQTSFCGCGVAVPPLLWTLLVSQLKL